MDCKIGTSAVVRDHRTDPRSGVKALHHGAWHGRSAGRRQARGRGIFFCSGFEAKCRSLIFHACLHPCIWKLNRMRLSPQAIHAIAQGSDYVQGCRVEVEFAFRGSQVDPVRRRSVVNGPEVGDMVFVHVQFGWRSGEAEATFPRQTLTPGRNEVLEEVFPHKLVRGQVRLCAPLLSGTPPQRINIIFALGQDLAENHRWRGERRLAEDERRRAVSSDAEAVDHASWQSHIRPGAPDRCRKKCCSPKL